MKLISSSLLVLATKALAQIKRVEPSPEPSAEPEQSQQQPTGDVHTNAETAFINPENPGTIEGNNDDIVNEIVRGSCDQSLTPEQRETDICWGLHTTLDQMKRGLMPRSDGIAQQARKLKQLKVLILWLQPEHRFARYCFYGCWCLPDREHKLFTVGYGKPVDNVDGSCQRQSKCYECAQMDHQDQNCDPSDVGYKFKLHYDPADPTNNMKKSIECTDDARKGSKHSCRRSICECDKRLSEDLREHFSEWYEGHHQEQGDFDAGANCLVEGCKNGNCGPHTVECCGNLGSGVRMPYRTDGRRKCCGDKTYDSTFQECCEGNTLAAIGTC